MRHRIWLQMAVVAVTGFLAASGLAFAKGWEGEMSLPRSIAVALENNPTYLTTQLALGLSEYGAKEARGRTNPQLKAEAKEGWNWDTSTLGSAVTLTLSQSIEGVHPLLAMPNYPRPLTSIQAANLATQVARAKLARARNELVYSITESYYGVLKAKSLVDVRKASVDAARVAKTGADAKLTAGTGTKLDVLKLDLEVANAELALIKAENAVTAAETDFFAVIGVDPPATSVDFPTPESQPELPESVEALQELAIKASPELVSAQLNVTSATSDLNKARRGLLPTVTASVTYSADHVEAEASWEPLSGTAEWGIGLSPTDTSLSNSSSVADGVTSLVGVSYPLFDAGVQAAVVKQSELTLQQAQAVYDEAVAKVKNQVLSASLSVADAKHSLDALEKAAAQAAEAQRLTELRVSNGAGTASELIDANRDLTEAKVNRTQAQFEYQIALAGLCKAVAKDKED